VGEVIDAVVEAPAASVDVAGAPTVNWLASVPVIVKGVVSVSEVVPLFVIVTGAWRRCRRRSSECRRWPVTP